MKKRCISLLLAAAMVFGLCGPLGGLVPEAGAAEIVASGSMSSRGDVTWTLDSEGTFTFSGEGRPPYVSPSMVVMDWEDYKEQIKRVVIEDGITAAGEYSFSGCTNLTSVSLADSVTSISDSTFSGCTGLTEIDLPDSVRSIGNHAFSGCTGLTEINLPNSVETIGNWAFSHCTNLTSVSLPNSVYTIGMQAFTSCESLTEVVLPYNLDNMGQSAFAYCTSLMTVYWPLSLDSYDQHFHGGSGALTVYYEGTEEDWDNIGGPYLTHKVPENTTVYYGCTMPNAEYEPEEPEEDPVTPVDPTITTAVPTPVLSSLSYRNDTVTVEWSVPEDTATVHYVADGYQILRKSGDEEYVQIGSVSGKDSRQYVDQTVELGQTYTYTVRAYYNGGSGVYYAKGMTITCGTEGTAAELYINPSRDMQVYYNTVGNDVIGFFSLDMLAGFAGEVNTVTYQPGPVTFTVELTGGFSFSPNSLSQHREIISDTLSVPTDSEPLPTVEESIAIYIRNNETGTIRITAKADTCQQAEIEAYRPTLRFLDPVEDTWPVINAAYCFKYPILGSYEIPVERYQEVYGERLGQLIARSEMKEWGGSCGGMAWTAGLIATRGLNLPYGFTGTPNSQADGQKKNYVYWERDSALTRMIERYQIFQTDLMGMNSAELNDLILQTQNGEYAYLASDGSYDHNPDGNYIQSVCDAITSSTQPLVLSIAWNGNAHCVLLTSNLVEDIGDGWYRTPIYDPNHPYLDDDVYDVDSDDWDRAYDNPDCYLYLNPEKNLFQVYAGYNGKNEELPRGTADRENAITYASGYPDRIALFNTMDLFMTEIDPDRYRQYLVKERESYDKICYSDQSDLVITSANGSATLARVENGQITYLDDSVLGLTLPDTSSGTLRIQAGDDYQIACSGSFTLESATHITSVTGQGCSVAVDVQDNTVSLTGSQTGEVTVLLSNLADQDEEIEAVEISGALENDQTVTFQLNSRDELVTTGSEHFDASEVQVLDETFTNVPQVDLSTPLDLTSWDEPGAFADVPAGAYYYDAVQWAVEQGITTGTSSTTFSPDAPCTRAQVVTFIWRALGLDELSSRSTENPFRDVPSGAYYCDPVLWAAENGITTGTSATAFSPDNACTRAQVVTFLWRTDVPLKKITGPVGFSDVRVNDYFWFPVKWALERDITTGTSATTFSPDMPCTRAQVVTFLYRDFA